MKKTGLRVLTAAIFIMMLACTPETPIDQGGTENPPEQEKPEEPTETDAPFRLNVYDISSVSATVEVEPADAAMAYYTDIINDADFKEAGRYGFDDYMSWLLESMTQKMQVSRSEVIEMISSYGNDGFIVTTLAPAQKYHAFAVGIDKEGKTTTEVVSIEFTTSEKETSDNTFTVSANGITTHSAEIQVITGNDDPYIFTIESKGNTDGLTDEELAQFIIQSNMAWGGLEQMTYTGNNSVEHAGMAGWEYEAIAFGYHGGSVTTDIVRVPFTMAEGGNPEACTFTFAQEFGTFDMNLSVSPSDNSVVYVSNIIEKSDFDLLMDIHSDPDMAMMENMEAMIEELMEDCGTRARVLDIIALMESQTYNLKFKPGAEYIQWAVPVSQDGTPTASFSISDTFKAPDEVLSKASLTLKDYTVYNGTELAEMYPAEFKSAKGFAVVDLTVEPSEEADQWWSYIAMEDLSDRPRETIIKNLLAAPTEVNLTRQLIVAYWGTNTIMGVAQDINGMYGPLLMHVVNLEKENTTPASQLSF